MSNGIDSLVECIRRRNEAIAERQWRRFETSYRRQVLGARPDPRDEPGRPAALRSVRGKFLDAIVSPDSRSRRPEPRMLPKIVFLLGAGTSLSAGVPLASTVVDECRKAIGRATLESEVNRMRAEFARQNSRETAWGRHLVDQKGAGDFSFEEVLSAYRYLVGEPELLELMRRRFRVTEGDRDRSLITLFNECLAHLCREQLVDFIVSLNFDELLEMSLDEDIGRDGYVRIVEEARFRWAGQYGLVRSDDDYTDPEQRRAKDGCERARPWLLKPHGTISHESTLCHLAGKVYRLGSEKEAVLKEVFADSCLVVVGYGLTALDFHRILMSHAVTGSIRQLIWVDPARHPGPMGTKLAQAMRRSRPGSFVHVSMEADDFALKLSERLYGDPSGAARRSRRASSVVMAGMLPPYRHFLRAFAFQRSSPGRPGVSCCFENRFVVECIALAVRMRGWWSSRALARSHQIQHLLRNATQEQRDRLSNLPGLLAPYFVSFPRRGRSERIYILRKRLTYPGAAGADPLGRDAAEGQREFVRRIQRCLPRYAAGSQRKDAARVTREMGRLIRQHPDVALYEEPDDLGTIRHAGTHPRHSGAARADRLAAGTNQQSVCRQRDG